MIELYAITDHPGPPLPSLAPLRTVAADGLAVVCAPAGDDEVSPEALWRHEEVVEALMEDRDLLPIRYGTRVHDERDAAHAVEERRDELAAALDVVRGAVELSLRVVGAGPRDTVLHTVHEPLCMLARAAVERRPSAESELLRAAYLVDRAAVERFTALVARLQGANPNLGLLCTGPWPPYSFAER